MLSSSKGETESFWMMHCDVFGQKEMQGEPSRKGHSGRKAWGEVILVQATKKAREETSKCLMGAEVSSSEGGAYLLSPCPGIPEFVL